jgi:hypothetical protein
MMVNIGSMDWFKGKLKSESPILKMGKSMVSGEDFPTNPLIKDG